MLAAGALAASAQSFTLHNGPEGPALTDGATVSVGYTAEDMGGFYIYTWNPHLTLRALSTSIVEFTVSSTCEEVQCCYGGACETIGASSNGTISKKFVSSSGRDYDLEVEMLMAGTELSLEQPREATVTVTADGQTTTLTLKFVDIDAASIADVTASASGHRVWLQGRTLHHSLNRAATLTIYTIAGRPAMTASLPAGQGTVAIDRLPTGVYVYSVDGITGKFIAK